MEYFIGIALGLCIGAFSTIVGFDRERSLYPVMLIVIASYYELFAVMGGGAALGPELAASAAFVLAAVIGFRTTLWIVVLGLVGHGVLDFFHDDLIANSGVPTWWPMFCGSIDIAAGIYLAWRLITKRIEAQNRSTYGQRIRAHVDAQLAAAGAAERAGDHATSFQLLQRAHVLSQYSTVQHVRVHMQMLLWALRNHRGRDAVGQVTRLIGAATKTWLGLLPHGNTGGSDVSAFKSMPIADDLAALITAARSRR